MLHNELIELVHNLRTERTDTHDVEVKAASKTLPCSITPTLSAFANGSGGLIVLGLEERNSFSLTPGFDADTISAQLKTVCLTEMTPQLHPVIQKIPFESGFVVVASITPLPSQDKPCYVTAKGRYGGSFIRVGDGDHRLSEYEINRLIEQNVQPRWDLEPIPAATLDDLDRKLLERVLRREREIHIRSQNASDKQLYRRLNIVSADDDTCPTLGALLALGEYPQQFFPQLMISYAVYPGISKQSIPHQPRLLDSGRCAGPIPDLITDALNVIQRNSRTAGIIQGAFRYDLPDFAPLAIREALTNALMHRDYSPAARGAQVQLNVYADHLEIQNPGGLYGPVTVDDLGTDGVLSSRNQILTTILETTPYYSGGFVAENRGSGYAEILRQQNLAGLPDPIPVNTLSSFTLRFNRRDDNGYHGPSGRTKVLNYLAGKTSATSQELSQAAGISLSGGRRLLRTLVDEGFIERTEPARSPKQRYRLRSQ